MNLYDIIHMSMTCKYFYNIFDDNFFKNLDNLYYSKMFWILAKQRPILLSHPLKSMKDELIRIENFQNKLEKNNNNRWTNKDFYNYWKLQTKFFRH